MNIVQGLIFYFLLCLSCNLKESPNSAPNILFLFADDQRSTTIGALGNQEIMTPNLNKLVSGGTSFDNAYIMGAMNGAVCAPSRAMLMTGRGLFNIDPTGNSIDSNHITMPKALERAGYRTFHVGKWHNGHEAFTNSFMDGSKIFFGGMYRQYNVPTYEYQEDQIYSKEKVNTPSPKHSSKLYADAIISFLENYEHEDPFFAYVAFQAPHDPREMPNEYLEKYDTSDITLSANFMPAHPFDNGELDIRDEWLAGYPRTVAEVKANIAAYYAMITHLDAQIGRILQTLEEKGFDENTIIVFAGDNGLAVGQHGLLGKQNLYEHSIGVPLIFRGPDIPKGKRTKALAYLSDIYPTLFDLIDAESIPNSVEGVSLKNAIIADDRVRNSMFYAYKNFQRAARDERWKIIKYNVEGEVTTQLFDLENDPFETNNLALNPDYKTECRRMQDLLVDQMKKNNDLANLAQANWGVPVLPAWKVLTDSTVVSNLRKLAEEERHLRGF